MNLPGLGTQEVKERGEKFGPNEITEKPSRPILELFLSQFRHSLVLVLVVAALISFFLQNYIDAFLILLIVFINALLGFWQEYKADRILSALKKLSIAKTKVYRDGKETEIDSVDLVPGDIVVLREGEKIPADGKIIESTNFEVNESSLTGESFSVFKERGSEQNQLYLGTIAVGGRAVYEITETGMNTRFGKIARELRTIKSEPTPLEKEISSLGRRLGLGALISGLVILLLGLMKAVEVGEMVFTSVSLGVAVVPEGLPAILAITLATGMQRMNRKKALIRRPAAIEAIGAAEVICTDKTGTLTQGKMAVRKVWLNASSFKAQEKEIGLGDPHFQAMLRILINANTATLVFKEDHGAYDILGDPMEGALLLFAANSGVSVAKFKDEFKLLKEFSFDPKIRTMSVVAQIEGGAKLYVKGAPEVILKKSRYLLLNNRKKILTTQMKEELEEVYHKYASEGLRVLALAHRDLEKQKFKTNISREEIEGNLVLVGFLGIADPPREEVKEAVRVAWGAGVKTVVITGDNELTTEAISKEIGLLKEGEDILTGDQVKKMGDPELLKVLEKVRIFARTSPEDKLRIVSLFQKKGFVTAVTGDGVNDALALKKSEVGIAMGESGTDVAREAADMVIMDDNYATIISAIEEGRIIYDNIVKGVRYLLSCNLAEVFFIFISLGLGLPLPLLPTQILWMNLVTDGLPALALSLDPKDPAVLKRPPRERTVAIANWGSMTYIAILGFSAALITLLFYALALNTKSLEASRSLSFTLLIVLQMAIALILARQSIRSNRFLIFSIIITLGLQYLILTVPTLQTIFKVEAFW